MAWLDNARLVAIFLVILLHVSVGVTWQSEAGSALWFYTSSTDVLVRCCVPLFVMISGALLLEPHKGESLSVFYRKRFSRILVPVLFWSLFYIVWGYFHENVQQPFTFSYVVERLASGKPYYHLWFMYMLMGLYAFTPVFRAIVAQLQIKELVFFVALAFGIEAIQAGYEAFYVGESNLFLTWFLTYVPFYFSGYLVRHIQLPVSTGKLALGVLLLAVAEVTLAATVALSDFSSYGGYFYKNLNAANIVFSVSFMFLLQRMNVPVFGEKLTKTLAGLTFGIYFIHMIPLSYLHNADAFWHVLSPYAYAPLFSVAVFVSTAIIAWVLSRVPYLRRVM